jgi:hypothetical protein
VYSKGRSGRMVSASGKQRRPVIMGLNVDIAGRAGLGLEKADLWEREPLSTPDGWVLR